MPIRAFPLELAYWQEPCGDLRLGHKLKYPYGFYGLMKEAQDTQLKTTMSGFGVPRFLNE